MCKVFEKYDWNVHKKAIPIFTGLGIVAGSSSHCRRRRAAAGLVQPGAPLAPSLESVHAVIRLINVFVLVSKAWGIDDIKLSYV